MMRTFKIAAFALVATIAGLLASNEAEALLSKHNCTFCHSLHGAPNPQGVPTGFVPQNSPTNIEVLCLGCHFNPVDGSDPIYGTDTDGIAVAAVQPHRSDGGVANYHVTCIDCHEIHDNMPNWLDGLVDGNHDSGQPGTPGTNQKMIGTRDPDGTTPYAVIRTREKDFDRNGIPDRGPPNSVAEGQTCDEAVINDCYTEERRYVVFEHADPVSQVHAWAENTGDTTYPLQDPATEVGGPGPSDPTVIRTNTSDSGALADGTNNWSAHDSICGMCHTQTANHNLLTGGGLTHNDTKACTDCHTHEGCFDKGGVCERVPESPTRDLQVDLVVVSSTSVNSGDTVTITVDVANLGDRYEGFDVRYVSDIDGFLGLSRAEVDANLTPPDPPGRTSQTFLDWVTTTAGVHTITAEIDPVIYETVIANNSATAADTVTVLGLDTHDVAVTAVTAPGVILQGDPATVSVDIANLGTFSETFDVELYDNTDDPTHVSPIGTLSSSALAPSGTTTLDFSWNTTGASLGSHTLEAIADTVPSETNTVNNSATTTSTVSLPTHDVAVDSVTAPASTAQGNTAAVDVVVSNEGTFTETFDVVLYDNTDDSGHASPIQTLTATDLGAGASTTLNFSWNTTGASIAIHTLEAVAATVTGETDTADNSKTGTAEVIPAGPINDVAVLSVTASPNPVGPTTGGGDVVTFTVIVENQGTVSETIDVTVDSDLEGATVCSITGVSLGAGVTSTTEFVCIWTVKSRNDAGTHLITATAATVPGETDTADNWKTTTLVVN